MSTTLSAPLPVTTQLVAMPLVVAPTFVPKPRFISVSQQTMQLFLSFQNLPGTPPSAPSLTVHNIQQITKNLPLTKQQELLHVSISHHDTELTKELLRNILSESNILDLLYAEFKTENWEIFDYIINTTNMKIYQEKFLPIFNLAIEKNDLEFLKQLLQHTMTMIDYIAPIILTDSKYPSELKNIIISIILHAPPLMWTKSLSAKYHFYLQNVPIQVLESLPEFASYLTIRKLLEEEAGQRGIPFSYQQTVLAVIGYESFLEEQKYEHLTMPKTVLLYVCDKGGFGDLITAAKMAHIIKQDNPNTQVIMIHTSQFSEQAKKVIRNFPCDCLLEDTNPTTPFDHANAIAIGVATVNAKEMQQNPFLQDIPRFSIEEYDADRTLIDDSIVSMPTQYISGLSMNALGIFVDENISPILTENQKKILQSYNLQGQPFYFGYVTYSNTVEYFLKTLVNYAKDNTEPLNVVLKCYHLSEADEDRKKHIATKENLIQKIKSLIPYLTTQNIGTICINGDTITIGPGSKKLNITLIDNPIPREHMRTLMQASQDLCLLTGDQSFSEAVSMNKIIIYEVRQHKISLWQNFCSLGRKIGGTQLEKVLQKIDATSLEDDPTYYQRFACELKKTKELYSQLNIFIATHMNIKRRLLLKIKTAFAQSR